MNPIDITLLNICSCLTGLLLGSWLAIGRFKAEKLREFIHFLSAWRTDIERLGPDDISGIWQAFVLKVPDFSGYCSNIRRDIWRKAAFDDIADPLRSLQYDAIKNPTTPDRRDVICGKINNLKLFLGANK